MYKLFINIKKREGLHITQRLELLSDQLN